MQKLVNLPIVCAYELSSALGFYERTVTAALNAGLICYIRELCDAVEHALHSYGITAPVMIGKGDGSLMDINFARSRPIETILSGPAASISGALFLSKQKNALVADIGGTTTDIAYVQNGHVPLTKHGANIGNWKTRVQAADLRTIGIGGDSHITLQGGVLQVGPRRVLPLSAAAVFWPQLLSELENAPALTCFAELMYLTPLRPSRCRQHWTEFDLRLESLVGDSGHAIWFLCAQLNCSAPEILDSTPLREGILQLSGLTPTDLLHIRGDYAPWCRKAPICVLQQLAVELGTTPEAALSLAFKQVIDTLRAACFSAAESAPAVPTQLIGIGAPAKTWIRALQPFVDWQVIVPKYSEVANAIGVGISQIIKYAQAIIRRDQNRRGYLLHLPDQLLHESSLEQAISVSKNMLSGYLKTQVARAGGSNCTVHLSRQDLFTEDEEADFIETRLHAVAHSLPSWRVEKT